MVELRADRAAPIDALLDRAVEAVAAGRFDVARSLAREVLESDAANADVRLLLDRPPDDHGELRRPAIMFCDLVGSTELSSRLDPETYRRIVGHYKETCRTIVEGQFDGTLMTVKGDGLLVLFGFPTAHEDDAVRAVRAGLAIVSGVRQLSRRAERELGESLSVRVGIHKGLVYIDPDDSDVFGHAANVASRVHELAEPGSLVVSATIFELLGEAFETRRRRPEKVKGVAEPLVTWHIVAERARASVHVPMVGRRTELELLHGAWADRPGAVLIGGEAGVGKSRLMACLADELAAEGTTLVTLEGSSLHTSDTLYPMRTLIERVIDQSGPPHDRAARLRAHLDAVGVDTDELVAPLAAVVGVADADARLDVDARVLRERVVAAATTYLTHAFAGPMLLVAEDVHWFDSASVEVLAAIVRARREDLLVVMTSRSPRPPRGVGATVVALGPLDVDDAGALVAALDPHGITASQCEALIARSDGIPLHIEALVRTAVDRAGDDGEPVVDAPPLDGVPNRLYEPLLARLDATGAAKPVVAAAAVIGRSFGLPLLAVVTGLDRQPLDRSIGVLVDSGIVDVVDGSYRFRHELLREVAYELQPPSARQECHGRIADHLLSGSDTTVEWLTLARHSELGRRTGPAIECYRNAVHDARRVGDIATAIERLGRALALVEDLPDAAGRRSAELELRLSRAALTVSSEGNASAGAATDYERALDLALTSESSDDVVRTLIPVWSYYTSRGELARGHDVIRTLRTVVDETHPWLRAENDAGLGMLHWFGGRFDEARTLLGRAADDLATHEPDERVTNRWFLPNDARASVHTHLGLAHALRGDLELAMTAFDDAAAVAATLAFPQGPFSAAYNGAYQSWALLHLGEFDAAGAAIDDVAALAERHGFDLWTLAAATQRCAIDVHRAWRDSDGDLDRIDRALLADRAAKLTGLATMWQMIDVRLFLPPVLSTLALALFGAGDVVSCRQRVDEAAAVADATGAHFCDVEIGRVSALAAADPREKAALLEDALKLSVDQGAAAFGLTVAEDLARLDPERGAPHLNAAIDAFAAHSTCSRLDSARARRDTMDDKVWQDAAGAS